MAAKFGPLLREGWEVIPLAREGGKKPLVDGHHGADHEVADEALVRSWAKQWPDCNPAIVLPPGVVGFDVDNHDTDGLEALAEFERLHGALPAAGHIFHGYADDEPSPYGTYLFRIPESVIGEFAPRKIVGNLNRVTGLPGVDVIAPWLRYNVAPGAVHKTGEVYEFTDADGTTMIGLPKPSELPTLTDDQARALLRVNVPKRDRSEKAPVPRAAEGGTSPNGVKPLIGATTPLSDREKGNLLLSQAGELSRLPEGETLLIEGEQRGWQNGNGFYVIACALIRLCAQTGVSRDKIKRRFIEACESGDYTDAEREWENAEEATEEDVEQIVARKAPDADDVRFRDALLVERVAQEMDVPLIHTTGLGWLEWNGKTWAPIEEARVAEVVRRHVVAWFRKAIAEAASDAERSGLKSMLNRGKIKALTDMLRGLLSREAAEFDRSPDLLNVRNGVIDLRTGELLEHDPSYLMTKIAGCEYHPDAKHEDWEKAKSCLEPDVVEYLLSRFGQCLTGHAPTDDKVIFQIGPGGNGKSTLLEPIRRAMGQFAGMVPQKLLLANPSDHSTEFMALRGLRLAICEELPEGGRLNMQRIKVIAGTEAITARNVFKDNVTFEPTHGLVVNTNHPPQVLETDYGTWRRLEQIEYGRNFRAEDRSIDKTLRQRVKRRAVQEAALADLVRHSVAWYANGQVMADPPAPVVAATRAWRGESDDLLAFFEEHLEKGDHTDHIALSQLLSEFNNWLEAKNRSTWGDRLLVARLQVNESLPQGFRKVRSRTFTSPMGRAESSPNPVACWQGVRWAS